MGAVEPGHLHQDSDIPVVREGREGGREGGREREGGRGVRGEGGGNGEGGRERGRVRRERGGRKEVIKALQSLSQSRQTIQSW